MEQATYADVFSTAVHDRLATEASVDADLFQGIPDVGDETFVDYQKRLCSCTLDFGSYDSEREFRVAFTAQFDREFPQQKTMLLSRT